MRLFTASGNLEAINALPGEGRGAGTSEAGGLCLGGPCWQSLGAMGVRLSDPRLLRWETQLSRAGLDSRGERKEPWQRKDTVPAGSESASQKKCVSWRQPTRATGGCPDLQGFLPFTCPPAAR